MKDIYRDGFLDGLRYAGHLLEDVSNDEVTLNKECTRYIDTQYEAKGYNHNKKQYEFIKRLILDCDRLYDENRKLRGLDPVENSDNVINYSV